MLYINIYHIFYFFQKNLLAENIWDTIAENQEENEIILTESQKNELDNRLKKYYKNPALVSNWSDVKKRIKSKI